MSDRQKQITVGCSILPHKQLKKTLSLTAMEKIKNNTISVCEIKLDKDLIHFQFSNEDSATHEITLNAGYDYICKTYFKHRLPTEPEVENAINYIEGELTSNKELANHNGTLFCNNDLLAQILNVKGKNIIKRDELEKTFNLYADCVTGKPANILQIDFTTEKLAVILLIREIMYHLDFQRVGVSE